MVGNGRGQIEWGGSSEGMVRGSGGRGPPRLLLLKSTLFASSEWTRALLGQIREID